MNVQEKKAAILDALLEHRGVGHVMSAASRVLGNPVLMVSRTGSYVGFSSTEAYGDAYWARFNAAMPSDKVLDEVERKGLATRLLSSDDTIRERFAFFDRDVLGTRVRDRVDVLGYVSVVLENSLNEDDERILVALARMLAVEIVYQSKHVSWRDEGSELVQGLRSRGDDESVLALARKRGLDGRSLQLVLVCFRPAEEVSLYFAKSSIEMNVSSLLCGVSEQSVVLLVEEGACDEALLDAVARCAGGCEGVGVSLPFTSIGSFAEAYEQAGEAVRLSSALGWEGPAYPYARVMPYRFIESGLQGFDLGSFVEPGVLRVRDYDCENGTELERTLRVFVDVGRNMNTCARRLYTHRNTVHYRLKRIYELLGVETIDDELAFSLALSFRALEVAWARN